MSAPTVLRTGASLSRPRRSVMVLIALVVGLVCVPSQAEGAGSDTRLGYSGVSHASGLHALYVPEGLLPTSPPVDLGTPDALTSITTGPATFARAAVADPGDLLANPDALLTQGIPDYPQGAIPPYPYRAEADSSGNQQSQSSPGPGLDAAAVAIPSDARARATSPGAGAPQIATWGTLVAESSSSIDGSTIRVHARSEVTDFELLGVLHIDSVVSEVLITADGASVTTESASSFTGSTIAGQPVTIDADGVHFDSPDGDGSPSTTTPIGGLLGPVGEVANEAAGALPDANDLLRDVGIRVFTTEPTIVEGQSEAQVESGGVRVELELSDETVPGLTGLFDAVPFVPPLRPGAPSVGDLIAVARTNHVVGFELGRASAGLSATEITLPTFQAPDAPGQTPTDAQSSPPVSPGPATSTLPAADDLRSSPGDLRPSPEQLTSTTSQQGTALATDIGGAALLALLILPLAGTFFERRAARLLAMEARCSWERLT